MNGEPLSAEEQRRRRWGGVVFVAMAAVTAVVAIYAVHGGAIAHNAVELPLESKLRSGLFLPEGWAFFTRDPRAADPILFERRAGAWQTAADQPAARLTNLYGLSRIGRSRYVELGRLLARVPDGAWRDCAGDPARCFDDVATLQLHNDAWHARVCGDIAVSRGRPVPWAWSSLPRPVTMPARVVRMRVRC